MKPVTATRAATIISVTGRYFSEPETTFVEMLDTLERAVDDPLETGVLASQVNSRADIIGVIVSATMPEMITEAARVTANSRNSAPVRPPVKASGVNTAASVIVMAMTADEISRIELKAAWIAVMCSSSMWRWMFSTTTMASSTTRPIASTIASSDRRLIE